MVNKLILTAFACCITLFASAQNSEESFKPVAGNKTLEVGLNLYGNTFGQLKLRKFSTETLAFRYSTSVSYNYSKPTEDASSYSLGISFAPGFEKHFSGTKRLSPYLGLSVPLTIKTSHFESDNVEVKGAASDNGYDRSYFSIGLNGLAGVDLYVVKNFYIGFEAGLGLSYFKNGEVEVNYRSDFRNNQTIEGYHSINFNSFTTGGLRVGFVF
ncbi:hypothetical protein ACFSRY_04465 [Pontibacter locisalis]|uniref:Outer membrane protein beta-barrel domain-containing protein n=1 Tax=Pontibacter locisalis TaxID=1719035 RepID=A0ABW5IHK4_9BACT